MKALIWPITLIGLVVASSAQAFEYVDNRGIRHWNHDSGSNPVIRKEVVQNPNKPRVEIVEDTVKFYPIDEDPSDSIAQQRNEQSSAAPTPLDQTAGRSIAERSRAVRHKPRRVKREQILVAETPPASSAVADAPAQQAPFPNPLSALSGFFGGGGGQAGRAP
jgi:hypothetical protein